MLHLERLEYFALLLQFKDLNSGLIELSPAFFRISVLSESREDVLNMENLAFAVDLLHETELLKLYAHHV